MSFTVSWIRQRSLLEPRSNPPASRILREALRAR